MRRADGGPLIASPRRLLAPCLIPPPPPLTPCTLTGVEIGLAGEFLDPLRIHHSHPCLRSLPALAPSSGPVGWTRKERSRKVMYASGLAAGLMDMFHTLARRGWSRGQERVSE